MDLNKLEENPLNDNFNCIIKKVNEIIEAINTPVVVNPPKAVGLPQKALVKKKVVKK